MEQTYLSQGQLEYELKAFPSEKRFILKGKNFSASLEVKSQKDQGSAGSGDLETTQQGTSLVDTHIEIPFFALPFKEKIQKELLSHLKKALQEGKAPESPFTQPK